MAGSDGLLTVVGLGPAGPDLITSETREILASASRVVLRTRRHPAAAVVPDATSFDHVYEQADTFDDVYHDIADRLEAAVVDGDVVYAVPGSPLVLERSVVHLRERAAAGRFELSVVPAMSFLDVAWARLGVDPVESGVRLVDGHVFATAAAGQTGPLLVAHCHSRSVLSELKLAVDDGLEAVPRSCLLLQRLGSPDEKITEVSWADLDRSVEPDHLTSLWIPEVVEPVAAGFARFDELVRTLRDQCPWDREQTHASLRRHLLEETHETLEALDARCDLDDAEIDSDLDSHLAEELGDLLYQVFFHARVAAERGSFTVLDVVEAVHDKLVHRHPHVFGEVEAGDVAAVLDNWESIKRAEKGRESSMDGVPRSLPALQRSQKLLERAVGSEVDAAAGAADALRDAARVAAQGLGDRDLGELLFAVAEVATRAGIDAEAELRAAAARFEERVRRAESR